MSIRKERGWLGCCSMVEYLLSVQKSLDLTLNQKNKRLGVSEGKTILYFLTNMGDQNSDTHATLSEHNGIKIEINN